MLKVFRRLLNTLPVQPRQKKPQNTLQQQYKLFSRARRLAEFSNTVRVNQVPKM